MNILANYNWIKDSLDQPDTVADFVRKMSAGGMSVEYTHDIGKRLEGMVVGVIKEVLPHPNADKLRITEVDIGEKVVTIVCGGVNLEVGHRVAVALPGSKVRWHGAEELTELSVAKVRGVESYGMIAAPEELGFDKLPGHDERGPLIWDVTEATEAPAGTSLADALELNDTVFDIEVTTNRPDAMSIVGLAREAGAVEAGRFHTSVPSSELRTPNSELPLAISVKESELCLRYQAVVMENVTVGPSPWWLQKRLLLAGHRPINNIVDITNYILHELGQPMHTFDYDRLAGGEIVVRKAKEGETMVALDGETYELSDDHLVIADAKKPVAIAGVMGGLETGTTEKTTRIVLECATFEPVNVRRTARALSLYSDSQQLFEKGLSTEATTPALLRAVQLVEQLAGGRVASSVIDVREEAYQPLLFPFDPKEVNARIGIEIPVPDQLRMLESLGFTLQPEGDAYVATVPYWRDHDIEDSVDFTEEIARVYGYHRLPTTLPSTSVEPLPRHPILVWQDRVKVLLSGAGCTELYHYSFASEADLTDWGFAPSDALSFLNPLSVDEKYLRLSLVPSVLRSIERNQGVRPSALLFELANVYTPREGDLPLEEPHIVIAGYGEGHDLPHVKGVFERLMREMGIKDITLDREHLSPHWHPGRSAVIKKNGVVLGFFGELAPELQERFGLNHRVALCVLHLAHLVPFASLSKTFVPIPEFPSVKRDVAFVVDRHLEYGVIEKTLVEVHALLRAVEPFDVYEGPGVDAGKKSMALHLELRSDEHTLGSEEIAEVLSTVKQVLEKEFSATMRS